MVYRTRKPKRRKNDKSKELNRLAFNLGLIERGKKNSGTQVHDSFNKGLEYQKKVKKPLF